MYAIEFYIFIYSICTYLIKGCIFVSLGLLFRTLKPIMLTRNILLSDDHANLHLVSSFWLFALVTCFCNPPNPTDFLWTLEKSMEFLEIQQFLRSPMIFTNPKNSQKSNGIITYISS